MAITAAPSSPPSRENSLTNSDLGNCQADAENWTVSISNQRLLPFSPPKSVKPNHTIFNNETLLEPPNSILLAFLAQPWNNSNGPKGDIGTSNQIKKRKGPTKALLILLLLKTYLDLSTNSSVGFWKPRTQINFKISHWQEAGKRYKFLKFEIPILE